ncbi:MAG: NAD+ synthase [Deltaproteobacteria bacterium]|nr:NAD+ synthase [Deltaproteobacteria bacterium]
MKIALAQINPTVGDLAGNRRLAEEAASRAADAGADLVVLPELALTGYPPMDLLERDRFVDDQLAELDELAKASQRIAIVVGAVVRTADARPKSIENAAVVLAAGRRLTHRSKTLLPTYDVFDEQRYFANAKDRTPVEIPGLELPLGLAVCEDTWFQTRPYPVDPVAELAAGGAALIVNPSASPWHVGKARERRALLADVAKRSGRPVVFVNQVGGNDELVFDGGSCVIGADGTVQLAMPLFEPGLAIVELPTRRGGDGTLGLALGAGRALADVVDPSDVEQLERGLVLGIRDYFLKQNLPPGAVIGLSGGIDSAVTAHLAVEALGADRVVGIAMPGPFSTDHSIEDAFELGRQLGIHVRRADIGPVYDVYRQLFAKLFGARDDYGLTQQNIQSRIRGAILMACSNEENRLVLATGNKSELSVGYCTLYGDTVGGLAVLGDVYKRDVYALARHANRHAKERGERIPLRTIEKPPSAELAADQFDQNDLPPYDILDDVLSQAIEGGKSRASIVPPPGCSDEVAQAIFRRLDRNEYKRRQTPLVLRTSEKAFGGGRRLPIVHRYTG